MVESTPPASFPDPRGTDSHAARPMAGDADADEDEDDPSKRLFLHEPVAAAAAAAMDDGDGDNAEEDEDDPGFVDLAASDGSDDDDDDGGSEDSEDRALIDDSGSGSESDGLANFVAVDQAAVDQARSEPGPDGDHDGDTQIVEIVETQGRGARHVHYRAVDGQNWHWHNGAKPGG